MKLRFIIAVSFTFLPILSFAAERTLPKGEEYPEVIERLYDSPIGEVQFTTFGKDGHSGFLRNTHGNLIGYQEVRGPGECAEWLVSDKKAELPAACEFFFFDEFDGRFHSVRSEEMIETSLFQAAKGKLRGWRAYVAL